MMRTASIKLSVTPEDSLALSRLQAAYADACNQLVPFVVENRCWNRVALHKLTYLCLGTTTPLGSQMRCNAIFSVCKAYKSQNKLKKIRKESPVPVIRFNRASVHFDKRTYSLKGDGITLYTLEGRIKVTLAPGDHQQKILDSGIPKEAELIFRKGHWYFNLVVESKDPEPLVSGAILGLDVGENNLAAVSSGKVWGGGELRHRRDNYLALRRRLQSNGTQSAKQLLRKVSGKERRRVRQINHETSKAIIQEAQAIGSSIIRMEDLTHIRKNIKGGRRIRTRLHRWAFRQLQDFVQYKAEAVGIQVEYLDPAYTSQTCSSCHQLGVRERHLFRCTCGFRAHADINSSRNLARIEGSILPPRAAVSRPNVEDVFRHVSP
jgi:IS605 OrfB family transposase